MLSSRKSEKGIELLGRTSVDRNRHPSSNMAGGKEKAGVYVGGFAGLEERSR